MFCFTPADVNTVKSLQKFEGQIYENEERV